MNNDERKAMNWYNNISEQERAEVVRGIPHSTEYGLTKSYPRLPEGAKQAVFAAFSLVAYDVSPSDS